MFSRHNDLPGQIRWHFNNQVNEVDLTKNGSALPPGEVGSEWHTDIPRLKAGKVGAQVYTYTPIGVLVQYHDIISKRGLSAYN